MIPELANGHLAAHLDAAAQVVMSARVAYQALGRLAPDVKAHLDEVAVELAMWLASSLDGRDWGKLCPCDLECMFDLEWEASLLLDQIAVRASVEQSESAIKLHPCG